MQKTRRQALQLVAATALMAPISACVKKESEVAGVEFHRNKKRPISSTTRFEAARFSGRWEIRGEFVHPGEEPLLGSVSFHESRGQITSLNVRGPRSSGERFDVSQIGPARFSAGPAPFETQYWVLWVDADYRTAAIGTPSGSFGWILDRSASGGADRIKAASDVLKFNGYNMSRLKVH